MKLSSRAGRKQEALNANVAGARRLERNAGLFGENQNQVASAAMAHIAE